MTYIQILISRWLVSNIFGIFTPKIGERFDDHIFQLGWFNHQLELFVLGFARLALEIGMF